MQPSILLLDCSENLEGRLKVQGFDVESGTIGFCDGNRKLPRPIYEKNIFIYNPTNIKQGGARSMPGGAVTNQTPEFKLEEVYAQIKRGAVLLAFVNDVAADPNVRMEAYSWIPNMPGIVSTKDYQILPIDNDNPTYRVDRPYLSSLAAVPKEVKNPVLQRLEIHGIQHLNHLVLYTNYNEQPLGVLYEMAMSLNQI